MKGAISFVLKVVGLVILLALVATAYVLDDIVPIGSGHAAKYICSKVFVSGQDADRVYQEEVIPEHWLFPIIRPTMNINTELKTVTSRGFGFWGTMTAVYRPAIGCTLTTGTTRKALLAQAEGIAAPRKPDQNYIWPDGEAIEFDTIPGAVDREKLNRVLDNWVKEPGPDTLRRTHAMVVVYGNQIVAEKYGENITVSTPLLGWSMSKSWTNALVGILVKDGVLDIHKPAPVPQWKGVDDPRGKITLDQLLRMSSGLEFGEAYDVFADATYMFYGSKSMANYAASKSLEVEPDTKWFYSSGTTNIIARIVRDQVGGTLADVHKFARQRLFDKLSMFSALIEPDPSGSLVGSSYGFATARDWARFGLLMKNDGIWKSERILPEGWVKYSTTPTPVAPRGEYGAQIWLNAGADDDPTNRLFPSLPSDLFYFGGHNGQIVAVVPSRDVVVVRLGVTQDDSFNREAFIRQVLACISQL